MNDLKQINVIFFFAFLVVCLVFCCTIRFVLYPMKMQCKTIGRWFFIDNCLLCLCVHKSKMLLWHEKIDDFCLCACCFNDIKNASKQKQQHSPLNKRRSRDVKQDGMNKKKKKKKQNQQHVVKWDINNRNNQSSNPTFCNETNSKNESYVRARLTSSTKCQTSQSIRYIQWTDTCFTLTTLILMFGRFVFFFSLSEHIAIQFSFT